MAIGRPEAERDGRSLAKRLRDVVGQEVDSIHPVALLGSGVGRLIPTNAGNRVRAAILRRAGWNIGRHSALAAVPTFCGAGPIQRRLRIGERTYINIGCFLELQDEIIIGDGVAIGHDVMFLTSSHAIGRGDRRAGATTTAPITVESGVWIGARTVILPGVTLGAGSVVAAGSIVNNDVDADTLVGGVPAKVVRSLPS